MKKILFILKYRDVAGGYSGGGMSSGLFNSARMIKEMLDEHGIHQQPCNAKIVQVIDNNGIDAEVKSFQPDLVIIEAVWVVPEKFAVLTKLHPNVKWIIRGHSNVPFLAGEGNAINWISEYIKYKNVFVATNTVESVYDLNDVILERYSDRQDVRFGKKILYFPNFYNSNVVDETPPFKPGFLENVLHFLNFHAPKKYERLPHWRKKEINVGCFGAVRLLKNQLIQAVASIRYAKKHNCKVLFHINASRVEGGGDPVIKNLRALFSGAEHVELVEHPWMPHDEFVRLIDTMDLSMQVSLSETFNIVTADAVSMGVPVVVSKEINWVSSKYQADPNKVNDIVAKMEEALRDGECGAHNVNQENLNAYNKRSHIAISNCLEEVLTFRDGCGHRH
jgi:hypothetical protein